METGTLEEHHDSLTRSHAQLKLDLNRARAQLRQQRQRNQEAQATEQLSQQRMASSDEALDVQSKYAWATVLHRIATGDVSPSSPFFNLLPGNKTVRLPLWRAHSSYLLWTNRPLYRALSTKQCLRKACELLVVAFWLAVLLFMLCFPLVLVLVLTCCAVPTGIVVVPNISLLDPAAVLLTPQAIPVQQNAVKTWTSSTGFVVPVRFVSSTMFLLLTSWLCLTGRLFF